MAGFHGYGKGCETIIVLGENIGVGLSEQKLDYFHLPVFCRTHSVGWKKEIYIMHTCRHTYHGHWT